MLDIIIIGAGPSGLTASIFAKRSNKSVLVFESSSYGGQIINTLKIDNYPANPGISGYDFATNLYNQTKELGVEFKFERVIDIKNYDDYKEVITSKNVYKCKSIIIATGLTNKNLNIPGEKELIGRGVSYCATCDGSFYKGKEVCVVGNLNTSLESAIYLSDLASKVYLVNRKNDFRAEESLVSELEKRSNIIVIENSKITKINGTNKLESINILNDNGEESTINIAGLFISVGRTPQNDFIKSLVKTDESGYIISGEDCHTNIDGIFASGDNRVKKLRQLVTACSDGAIAASEAIKYVNNK
jgi:thioredoxin reductase (NADPH)